MARYSRYRTDGATFRRNVQWVRMPRPYRQVNPYALDDVRIAFTMQPEAANLARAPGLNPELVASCHNQAYAKFVSKLGDRSEMGVNLVEARRSVGMITNRAFSLLTLATKFRRSVKSLKLTRPKDIAGLWLEYSFGWAPMISDIYNAADVLQRPLPGTRVAAGAKVHDFRSYPGPVPRRERYSVSYEVRQNLVAHYRVVNPNLFLMNQLGLVNPASIAWELVPWSFVVDWFTTAGAVIGSMTDFVGLELNHASTTTVAVTSGVYTWTEPDGSLFDAFASRRVQMSREVGISGPTLAIRPFKGWSLQRGANALSLAVQQLKRA